MIVGGKAVDRVWRRKGKETFHNKRARGEAGLVWTQLKTWMNRLEESTRAKAGKRASERKQLEAGKMPKAEVVSALPEFVAC